MRPDQRPIPASLSHPHFHPAAPIGSTVDLCAGPGGWDEAAGLLGAQLGIVEYDISGDACATARAAGHHRVQAHISRLSEPRTPTPPA